MPGHVLGQTKMPGDCGFAHREYGRLGAHGRVRTDFGGLVIEIRTLRTFPLHDTAKAPITGLSVKWQYFDSWQIVTAVFLGRQRGARLLAGFLDGEDSGEADFPVGWENGALRRWFVCASWPHNF